jgi:hypothetical protein
MLWRMPQGPASFIFEALSPAASPPGKSRNVRVLDRIRLLIRGAEARISAGAPLLRHRCAVRSKPDHPHPVRAGSARAQPLLCRQLLERRVVRCVHVLAGFGFRSTQKIIHVAGKHRANGMNGLMSVEAFRHEALHCARYRYLVAERDLVFHHDMDYGMRRQIRHANTCVPMKILDQPNLLLLVELLPLFGIGRAEWIVIHALHRWPLRGPQQRDPRG